MRPGSKVVVGVGGNIGTGKTTVVSAFRELGAQCIGADELGWEVLPEIVDVLKREFGEEIVNGCDIDRKRLRDMVFSDRRKLRVLNRVSHPLLVKRIIGRVEKARPGIVVIDAALLFDWPQVLRIVDIAILVRSPRSKMVGRARAKGITPRLFSSILSTQKKEREMARKAHIVIDNDGTKTQLRRKCRTIYRRIADDC